MKRVLLLTISMCLAFASFAQHTKVELKPAQVHSTQQSFKTTGIHDSVVMTHLVVNDTVPYYLSVNLSPGSIDSGYFAGTSLYEFNRFAERYDFSVADSSVQVIGVLAALKGRAGTPSTHTAVFKVWNQGAFITKRPTLKYSGFPSTQIDSVVVPYSELGFGALKPYYFPYPTAYLYNSFFVGFTTDYTWATMNGDTMSVYLTGQRLNPLYDIVVNDTTVNDQTVIGDAMGWADLGIDVFTEPMSRSYWLFPIVNSRFTPASIGGITRKDFTFLGNYPNPCVNEMNIRYAVAGVTDVTVLVMDDQGRTIKTEKYNNVAAGEHVVSLDTRDMPAGSYLLLISTANGGGLASKIAVIK